MSGFSVFTYETLEIPAVMEAVTGRSFESVPGTTKGYERFLLKGRIYPGMTPMYSQANSVVSGRVYFGLDSRTLDLLDQFEDDVYVRREIWVHTAEGDSMQAYAYIIDPKERKSLSADSWDIGSFKKKYLANYLVACRAFHKQATDPVQT